MRDSYGIIVHGEIPEGVSPRKLTVRPWKASDFPDLQLLSLRRKQPDYLETESSTNGSFYEYQHGLTELFIKNYA